MGRECPAETRVFDLATKTVQGDKRDNPSRGASGDSEQVVGLPVRHLITKTNGKMYAWLDNPT